MCRAPKAPRAALAAALLVACGHSALPNLDINGVWSLNWMATRYPMSDRMRGGPYFDEWYFSTWHFTIEELGTSEEGGTSSSSGLWKVIHSCPTDWSIGSQSEPDRGLRWGADVRWSADHPNTLLFDMRQENTEAEYPAHCSFPSADRMRCMWGPPFAPADRVEERDEVLVFDRGDAARSPVPCERVAERALIGPHLE
jgi:hypothetical protein